MRTLFTTGIQSPRSIFWMGQQTGVATTTTPTATKTTETSWLDVLAKGIESGADAYGTYGDIKEDEYGAEGKEADAAAREASARAAQIMQQTQLLNQQSLAKQNQVGGIDKTVLFIGASLLGLLVIGGTFFMLSKK